MMASSFRASPRFRWSKTNVVALRCAGTSSRSSRPRAGVIWRSFSIRRRGARTLDWGTQLGYDADALATANSDAVQFARGLADGRPDVTINGRARAARRRLRRRRPDDRRQAADYHAWQIGVLADAGVERVTALTLSYPEEATGIVQAAAADRRSGRRVLHRRDRRSAARRARSVAEAIEHVDAATDGAARVLHDQLRAPDPRRRRDSTTPRRWRGSAACG